MEEKNSIYIPSLPFWWSVEYSFSEYSLECHAGDELGQCTHRSVHHNVQRKRTREVLLAVFVCLPLGKTATVKAESKHSLMGDCDFAGRTCARRVIASSWWISFLDSVRCS